MISIVLIVVAVAAVLVVLGAAVAVLVYFLTRGKSDGEAGTEDD